MIHRPGERTGTLLTPLEKAISTLTQRSPMQRALARIPWPGWLAACLAAWVLALYFGGGRYLLRFGAAEALTVLRAAGWLAALYLLPGAALLLFLWPRLLAEGRKTEFFLLSLCAGAVWPALLLEAFHLVGVRFSRAALFIFLAACLAAACFQAVRLGRGGSWRGGLARWAARPGRVWLGVLLGGLLGLLLAGRLAAISGLEVGMWGDSYQHTMITQLLADNGGLFESWLPYAPLNTFTYHYGFHANAVFLHWLAGLPVPQAVLLSGQVLNWLAIAGCAVFAIRLTGSTSAGLAAVVLVGLINPTPAFFFNWGRYTQLAGMVILPAALLAWERLLTDRRFDWRSAGLAGILTAGLACTHYIITIFLAAGVLALVLVLTVRRPSGAQLWRLVRYGAAAGLLGIVLAAPWLANTLGGNLARNTGEFLDGSVGEARIQQAMMLDPLVPETFHGLVLAAAAVGALVGIARRQWRAGFLLAWTGLMLFIALPGIFGLPGTGAVDLFTVNLSLYLPAAGLAGFLVSGVESAAFQQGWGRLAQAAGAALLIAASVWGATIQHDIRDEYHQFFTPADSAGMEWIRQNTAEDSLFLVNATPAYGGTLVVGNDGGWWIPLLTGRQSTLPPLTYGSEQGSDPGFARQVNTFYGELRGQPISDQAPRQVNLVRPGAVRLLEQAGVDYIYLGAKSAPGYPFADWIDTSLLRDLPGVFRLVYDQDGVKIYRVEHAR